ncbi:LysR family transcriptional regulator [Pandoraea commovens]|uniref:LysR family transcriptional regulator n=1 Tax=Pandoraea commovens TaxID=2508289 RepID=A0A5E4X0M7_9BURK|nr:LysR family transcriptional regulator [Pandoraea commovens]UVA80172.1 LysR family transcriptional regulator [Pandoraea commovens]VVE29789.1 LysR family transcriptional regulator [Pandoraea commovens]
MLDLGLLKTLVAVVDEGSFTRAAERVHRTQSTVSQQIRRLEDELGRQLLMRDRSGVNVTPTLHGELLAQYARKLLALSMEAVDAMENDSRVSTVRVGLPEDIDARRMADMLSRFVQAHGDIRLEIVAGMSADLRERLSAGDLELALVKREPGQGDCLMAWPETLVWAMAARSAARAADCLAHAPVPLALFPQGCIYRQRAIRSLDAAQRPWRMAFGSHSLTGIQAAVSSGLGVSVLPETVLLPDHAVCDTLPPPPPSEIALMDGGGPASASRRALADFLAATVGETLGVATA